MAPDEDSPDARLTPLLTAMLERLGRLEHQVNGLLKRDVVWAQTLVIRDDHGDPRARFELAGESPQLLLFDSAGRERLRLGLRPDGTPAIWMDGREVPVIMPENRG